MPNVGRNRACHAEARRVRAGDKLNFGVTFEPSTFRPRFAGGHRQTLYAWARRRTLPQLPQPVERYFDVSADARVLAHCHWQEQRTTHPVLILLHGLEGSSSAHYMRGIAEKAWLAGWTSSD